MRKYVVLSSNQVPAYAFMAPLAVLAWQRTAFTPVVLLTQTREHWDTPTGRVVVDMLDRLGCQKHYVGLITDPYRTSVQAQAARQHAARLSGFEPTDYVMTMDVDALPINADWFDNVDWSLPCHLRNASAWQHRWYTTFGFGATVAAWREFMGYAPAGEIASALQANLDHDLTPERDTMSEWFFDEFLWCSRLFASRFWPEHCQPIERSSKHDRLDRSNWPPHLAHIDNYLDAHVLRPAHTPEHWPRTRRLLELLVPNQLEEICHYHARYTSAL